MELNNLKKVVMIQLFSKLSVSLYRQLIHLYSYEIFEYQEGTGCVERLAAAVRKG